MKVPGDHNRLAETTRNLAFTYNSNNLKVLNKDFELEFLKKTQKKTNYIKLFLEKKGLKRPQVLVVEEF